VAEKMTAALQSIVHILEGHHLIGWIANSVFGFSIAVTIYTAVEAFFALRAKSRLQKIISSHMAVDNALREELFSVALNSRLGPAELDAISKKIEKLAFELGRRERRLVESGLSQMSQTGRERFVRELISTHAA